MLAGFCARPMQQTTVAVPRPRFQWEPGSYGIADILKTHDLPVTVQCDLDNCNSRLNMLNFDITQPLVLYKARENIVSIDAMSVVYSKEQKQFIDTGETVLIPRDYKGWFAVLGNPEDIREDKPVPYYSQVEQLAVSKCETFLIGGSEHVEAIEVTSGQNTPITTRNLFPGDVFKKRTMFQAKMKPKLKMSGSNSKLIERKFLMCTDEKDREFMIALETRGVFYMISGYSSSASLPVLQISEISERVKYPCLAKLLYGNLPITPCLFTGALLFNECYVKSSIIASTLLNLNNVLLELPFDIQLKFRVAVPTVDLLSNPGYTSALVLCQARAETYSRSMKIFQTLPPDRHSQEDNSVSNIEQHTATTDERPESPLRRDMFVPIHHCSNTQETDLCYEQVWYQNIYSPNTASTDKKDRMCMSVPLGQPVSALQPPQVLPKHQFRKACQAPKVEENISINEQDITLRRTSECNYQKLIPKTSRSLRAISHEYQQLIHPESQDNSFIVNEEINVVNDEINEINKKTSIPEAVPITNNLTSLNKPFVSEISHPKYLTSDARANLDDLPLGADSSFFSRPFSTDAGVKIEGGFQESLGSLSVSELCEQLLQLGIKKKTIEVMKNQSVDGSLLQKLDENKLRESFPEITNIEMKKIAMFLQGWKPQS